MKAQEAREARVNEQLSPTATALSGASTLAEQREAGLCKSRSDLRVERAPYKPEKKMEKERTQLMKDLTPEERKLRIEKKNHNKHNEHKHENKNYHQYCNNQE